jgi:hypothetical protein
MTETCLDCKEKVVAFSSCKVLRHKLLLSFFLRDKWSGPSFPQINYNRRNSFEGGREPQLQSEN